MASVRQAIPADDPDAPPSSQGELQIAARDSEPLTIQNGSQSSAKPSIDDRFESLLRHVQANRPSEDVSLIRKAWEFCVQHHEGQMRASGEPYVIHPLEVAEVLAEMKLDETAIAAGLLHDGVADAPVTSER